MLSEAARTAPAAAALGCGDCGAAVSESKIRGGATRLLGAERGPPP